MTSFTQKDLLETPIDYLKGVGPKKAELFRQDFNVYTYDDLLHYYPYRHVDKSKIYKISELSEEGTFIQFKGIIRNYSIVGQQRGKRLVATFVDDSGSLELVWFNSIKWIEDLLKQKRDYIIFGKPTRFNGRWNITHPELIDPQNQSDSPIPLAFQPLYYTSEKAKKGGLDSKAISKLMITLITQTKEVIPEILSDEILQSHKLLLRKEALSAIHYPSDNAILSKATTRLKFDELFFTQMRLLKLKLITSKKIKGHHFAIVGAHFNDFYHHHLKFELTNAQKRVIKEIRADMGSGKQMNRLLQGDVGSGKTITALLLMLIAIDNGFQTCLMAPTEILATQHFENISKQLAGMDIKVEFLSGSTKVARRRAIHEQLLNGEIDILIGTHALIEKEVTFKNLGFVVIDEQHRFGVEQRAKLWQKNQTPPHILVMTATPIPRTLSMTLYGDLDLSVIDELPKGRKPIITKHLFEKNRLALYGFMKSQIEAGRQIFVVYPLIEENEKLDLLALMEGYDIIATHFPLPQYAIGLVHGKMKATKKEFEMQRFIKKETQILLSTTVIEVGIDVPNATVMVVENAERFGLSQLHQLRGRVGRGGEQSYCLLVSGNKLSNDSKQRLAAMVNTNDGFEIANIDLELRGPGDIQGTKQSGMLDFKIADLVKDEKLIAYTRQLAQDLLLEDADLALEKNMRIKNHLAKIESHNLWWGLIS
ncbi:MAG: ATP-dependent DNA helicase RecG [Bacteroidales bacterium]|jgi:ATP-dependent DNA helicase RecG|nr:ATP-dependent DNA helicase RecG [Bacteroidales bacterium]